MDLPEREGAGAVTEAVEFGSGKLVGGDEEIGHGRFFLEPQVAAPGECSAAMTDRDECRHFRIWFEVTTERDLVAAPFAGSDPVRRRFGGESRRRQDGEEAWESFFIVGFFVFMVWV